MDLLVLTRLVWNLSNGIPCIRVCLTARSLKSEIYVYQALHKFSKNLGPTSKFLVPEGWNEDKLHTEEQQISVDTVTKLVNMATKRPRRQ